MADLTPQDMAAKLLASGFERNGPSAATLGDPIADTPMVVTLDQLRPYDHDPRVTRNPAYAEIKASIRERGLDAWVLGSVGVLGEEDPADTLITGTKGVHGGAVRLQGEYRTA